MARLAVLALAAGAAGCAAHEAAAPLPTPPPVATRVVTAGSLAPRLTISGMIAPFRAVGIAASADEPIAAVFVREGARVRAGSVLAQLDVANLRSQAAAARSIIAEDEARVAQTAYANDATSAAADTAVAGARAALRQAVATLATASRNLARETDLERQGYLAEMVLENEQTTVVSDRQAVAAAQAAVADAQANARASGDGSRAGMLAAQLAAAQQTLSAARATAQQIDRDIARATLTSPVDGVVEAVNAQIGEYPGGRELFTIHQLDRVYAVLPTSSRQSAAIVAGDAVLVDPGDGRAPLAGRVDAVLDQIEPGATSFVVRALVDNPAERLRAGMPVTATVQLPRMAGTLIPVSAFADDDRKSVFAVDRAGDVRSVPVATRAIVGDAAIVTGLAAGSRIVSDAIAAGVAAGDRLAVR